MANDHSAELYLRPHIVRYLYTKLNDRTQRHTPHGDTIWRELLRELQPSLRLVELQPLERHGKLSSRLRLGVALPRTGDLTTNTNRKIALYVEREYTKEFCAYVDREYYERHLAPTKRDAMHAFRALYGITDEDLAFETSERSYQRYEATRRRVLKRGGKRPNSGPAKGSMPSKRP